MKKLRRYNSKPLVLECSKLLTIWKGPKLLLLKSRRRKKKKRIER